MKINVEELKVLTEAGDESALQAHIFASLEKGDVIAAAEANNEVLSEVDSLKDKHHQKALETFKKNEVPKLIKSAVDEKVKELNPTETPEQQQIRELQELFNKEKQKSARAEVRSKLIEVATSAEVGLDAVFVAKHIDKFVPRSFEINEDGEIDVTTVVESVKQELTGLSSDFKTVVSKQVEETMKGVAGDFPGGGLSGGQQEKKPLGAELAERSNHTDAKEKQQAFFK